MREVLPELLAARGRGVSAAMATVVRTWRSAPRPAGASMLVTDEGEATLGPYDSCYLAPNEARAIENRTNRPASILVVMPYPAA